MVDMTKRMLSTLAGTVVTVAIGTALVMAIIRAMGGLSLSVNQISTNKQSTFDVTGESKISTIPDQAEINLGITVNETTVKAAQDKANKVINDINAQLAGLGVEKKDIKTENYSLYPNYDYQSSSGQRIIGYSVNASLVVTLKDFSKLNQAVDLATSVGANQIGGISFTLSDDKEAEIEREARQEAITNAKDKASELAKLAGMRLGKIVNVSETPNMSREAFAGPVMLDMAKGAGGGVPTNVEPGSTSFSYSVTLSYETL